MTTVIKGKVVRSDLAVWDGIEPRVSRRDSTGGTISSLPVNDFVDVLEAYGSGLDFTLSTINRCTTALGSKSRTLVFRPGTWTIDDNVTIASNFTIRVPAGAVFDVSSGKTLTFSGPVLKESYTWTSGSGTVVANEWLTPSAFMATAINDADTTALTATLNANFTGTNTALGGGALDSNTTGTNNAAFGLNTLTANTTASSNTAVGSGALDANTTASNNTAVGASALGANTTGADNTVLGSLSMASNTTGASNTGIGRSALGANTTGVDNTAVGYGALIVNTTGASNVAVGRDALATNV